MKIPLLFLPLLLLSVINSVVGAIETGDLKSSKPFSCQINGNFKLVNNSKTGTMFILGEANGFSKAKIPFSNVPGQSVKVSSLQSLSKPFSVVFTDTGESEEAASETSTITVQGTLDFQNGDKGTVSCTYKFTRLKNKDLEIKAKVVSLGVPCTVNNQNSIKISKAQMSQGIVKQDIELSLTLPDVD